MILFFFMEIVLLIFPIHHTTQFEFKCGFRIDNPHDCTANENPVRQGAVFVEVSGSAHTDFPTPGSAGTHTKRK